MYHKSNYSNYVSVTFTAVNEIKFWDCYYIYQNLSPRSFELVTTVSVATPLKKHKKQETYVISKQHSCAKHQPQQHYQNLYHNENRPSL